MDLFEFENKRFGSDLWTKETIEECQKAEPNENTGTPTGSEPQYQVFGGKWFGLLDWMQ